jgi:S1-C subfamily serine protease
VTRARSSLLLLCCGCAAATTGGELRAESWLESLHSPEVRSQTLRERSAPIASGAKGDIREVYKKVAPATVLIRTPNGYGTGILIDARGFVLTNHHVIAQAETVDFKRRVSVELGALGPQGFMEKRGTPLVGWVLKSDPLIDLAVLKLESPPADLVAIDVSPSDPQPGEPVSALGHGGIGLLWAIRDGEVASVGRLATHLAHLVGAECQATLDPALAAACASSRKSIEAERARVANQVPGLVIQTSCTLSPGDSGGPPVNRAGQLVGVNAFLQPDSSAPVAANFHVHVAEVRTFLKEVPTEPAAQPPEPVALMRGLRTTVRGDSTVAMLPRGAIAIVDLGDVKPTFAIDGGRRMVWLGNHLVVETPADSGRGVEWLLESPPRRVADDALLFDTSKLSEDAAKRYAAAVAEVLGPWNLAPKVPLEQMPPLTRLGWRFLDRHTAWSEHGEVRIDDIVIVRRGQRAWWKRGDELFATEDADSGAITFPKTKAGRLFAAEGLAHLDAEHRERVLGELRQVMPALASDDLLDVGPIRSTEENGTIESVSGPRGVAILIKLDGKNTDMAWVRRGDSEWFVYDTAGKGTFDVTLFKEKKGVRPSLFKDSAKRAAFEKLARVYFNSEVIE